MFDLRSLGASFATFREFYKIDSGMISISGDGGGSEETKQRKSGCAPSSITISKLRSKDFIQVCMRCTF